MKKILFLAMLLTMIALPAAAFDSDVFYYSDGHKIMLQPDDDFLLIKYRALPPDIKADGKDVFVLKNNRVIQKVADAGARSALETSSNVLYVSQVYGKPGARLAPTNEIIVKFLPCISKDDINAINKANGAVIKRMLLDGSYLLELKVKRGEDAIAVSNKYYLLDETEYAHPDFFRSLKIRPEGPKPVHKVLDKPLSLKTGPDNFADASGPSPMKAGKKQLETIFKDKFGGAFPGENWDVFDNDSGSGEAYWGKTGKKYKSPSKSVWCAKGGDGGVKPGKDYPDDMDAWMIYGPFSLADANYAEVTFKAWIKTEPYYDWFSYLVSTDGSTFRGYGYGGYWASYYHWMNTKFNLIDVPELGDLSGASQVWFALWFESDSSTGAKGAYVDDVMISKFTDSLVDISGDPLSCRQWSLNNIGQNGGRENADVDAPEAWETTTGDSDITVAVIDEGVDLGHPDLSANLVAGYDATDQPTGDTQGGQEPGSDDAHGTCCAGIIAAVAGNGIGITGVAPGVRIMPVRIAYSASGWWVTSDAWIADGITWAWQNGADVLSNSWGGGSPSDTIKNAIRNAKNNGRNSLGCVVLFASGNDNGKVSYPAKLKEVIAVGALSPCDQRKSPKSCDGEFWWGSNKGTQLDVAAPGVQIPTTDISGEDGYEEGDYTLSFNGTSSACPLAAGVVALMLSVNPDLTQKKVKKKLYKSCDDIGAPGRDNGTGHGRVNARKAVLKAMP